MPANKVFNDVTQKWNLILEDNTAAVASAYPVYVKLVDGSIQHLYGLSSVKIDDTIKFLQAIRDRLDRRANPTSETDNTNNSFDKEPTINISIDLNKDGPIDPKTILKAIEWGRKVLK